MTIITDPQDMQQDAIKSFGQKTVGFVPTMGALHEGHLSLIRKSKQDNDKTIVSIFLNPTQFGENEDLSNYPSVIEEDIKKLEGLEVDTLFLPNKKDIYPETFATFVTVEGITNKLCGLSRPVHFRGVSTICTKLFLLTLPTVSYFGQKDYQQSLVIRRLVKDLNISTQIEVLPIIRDADGLALSSRNVYLSANERVESLKLNQTITQAENLVRHGEKEAHAIKTFIKEDLSKSSLIKIDYISICHPETLEELTVIGNHVLIAVAIYIGSTRLIDNCLLSK